jgi:NADPH:quinone reductase-like Zn-dependent oxidoreductase
LKAIVSEIYGTPDVFQLKEIKKPFPKDNEVLIKIYATTVTAGDTVRRSGKYPLLFWFPTRLMFGLRKPRKTIPGGTLAGEIEEVGKNVKLFKKGDQVYGEAGLGMGACAEYICLPEKPLLALKPNNMTFEEAAGVPDGAITSLYFLRKGNIKEGQKVLINGASGGNGTYAVQLAKYFGTEVTGVCSTKNIELVKSLGADKVIDYTKEDFTKKDEKYDIIYDPVGKTSFSKCKNSLNSNGFFLTTVPNLRIILQALWTSILGNKRVISGMPPSSTFSDELIFLKGIIEEGKLKTIIDRSYPLEQLADAHKYVEKGHKKGNVVITND